MTKIGICEDDEACCAAVRQQIEQYEIEAEVTIFSNGESFCEAVQTGQGFDIVLMDIDMGDGRLSGIETAKWLRKRSNFDATIIIFVTSHVELAEESFSVNPFYFLRKPVDYDKFGQILHWAIERLEEGRQCFEYRRYQNIYRIALNNIRYFGQSSRGVCLVHANGSENIRGRLSQVEERLRQMNTDSFCRINHSCIVNLEYVKLFRPDRVILTDGTEFLIGGVWRNRVQEKLGSRFFQKEPVLREQMTGTEFKETEYTEDK